MDEQHKLDLETKAARYDRISRCAERVERAHELVIKLRAQLKNAEAEEKAARWDLALAMSPVKAGVRG